MTVAGNRVGNMRGYHTAAALVGHIDFILGIFSDLIGIEDRSIDQILTKLYISWTFEMYFASVQRNLTSY